MASSSPRRTSAYRLAIQLRLLLQLLCILPAAFLLQAASLSCLERNNPNSGDKILSLRPDDADAEQPSVVAYDQCSIIRTTNLTFTSSPSVLTYNLSHRHKKLLAPLTIVSNDDGVKEDFGVIKP